ncbi:uncharacterized protein LOC133071433 [Dama dama]|uniref:uncharacterized protein LOC133071433 n=1 Tax=Dama dama TaxID=30532 RepID=UPI002A3596B1|nr:uncharacterized protein LOC133071433 [Dama dama]
MDCSLPVSSLHGIFQARILEWVAMPYSRGSPGPRDRTGVSCVSCTKQIHPYTTKIYAHGSDLAEYGETLKASPKEELVFKWLQHFWHKYTASQNDCSLRWVSEGSSISPPCDNLFNEALPSDNQAQLNSCLNVNNLMRAFSTLLQLWAPDMPGTNGYGESMLLQDSSSPWQPVQADLCLSVSRLATLQGHLCHSNKRKLRLTSTFQVLWKQGFNPRPHLILLCSFLVRNYLTPEVGGLRTTGCKGGFWDVRDIDC